MKTISIAVATVALPLVAASEKFEQYRYQPKAIDPEDADGGIDKLVDRGVFRRLNDGDDSSILRKRENDNSEGHAKPDAGTKRNIDSPIEQRSLSQLRSGARATQGGNPVWSPVYDDDDDYFNQGTSSSFSSNTNAGVMDDDLFIDDTIAAEEVLYLSAFQDNSEASSTPIFANPANPDPATTGNLWVYSEIPLQPEFDIGVGPLLGQVHGTCESTFMNLNGYCAFTYEFFDGAPEVIASMTVEGATNPTGPTILTVSGGSGELAGVSGEVQLTPVILDSAFMPPRIMVDDSTLFLGNPTGYLMEAVVYVRFRVADVVDDIFYDDPVVFDEPDETAGPNDELIRSHLDDDDDYYFTVQCPGELSVCDCGMNCVDGTTYCDCMEGLDCCTDPDW